MAPRRNVPELSKKSKYWCWTLNNYTAEEKAAIDRMGEERLHSVSYLTYGQEGKDEEKTPHLQGYMEFSIRKKGRSIKNLDGFSRAHLEVRKGTAEQAKTYCAKEDPAPVEYGSVSTLSRGQRTDLQDIQRLIDHGASVESIAVSNFSSWVIHRRAFTEYAEMKAEDTVRMDLKVIVLFGLPGTGKSRYAYHKCPDLFSIPSTELKWFDGYRGESTVLLDDYRGDASDSFILKVLDIYPLRVPVKGGYVKWRPTTIYITSNLNPLHWNVRVNDALRRRIHHTVQVDESIDFDDLLGWEVSVGLANHAYEAGDLV